MQNRRTVLWKSAPFTMTAAELRALLEDLEKQTPTDRRETLRFAFGLPDDPEFIDPALIAFYEED